MSDRAAKWEMSRGAFRAVIFLFLFTLFLGAANLLFTAHEVHNSNANHASIIQLCETGNDFRMQQRSLWQYLVLISSPPPNESPTARKERLAETAAFLRYVDKVFAPRNCQEISAGGNP